MSETVVAAAEAGRSRTPPAAHAAVNLIGGVGLFLLPAGMTAFSLLSHFLRAYTVAWGTRQEAHDAVVASYAWMIAAGVLIVVSTVAIIVLRAVIHSRFLDGTIWSIVGLLMTFVAYGLWRFAAVQIALVPA